MSRGLLVSEHREQLDAGDDEPVAESIKRRQIAWAKANGVCALRTANERRLVGLLALNRRLGYRRLYTEIVPRGPAA